MSALLSRALTRPGALQLTLASVTLLVWFAIAGVLPHVGGDLGIVLADVPSLLALAGVALAMTAAWDDPLALVLLLLGAGLIAGAASVAEWHAGAGLAKALFAGSLGMFLSWWLDEPALAVVLPLFVAGIDIASVSGGPTELLIEHGAGPADFLSVRLPALGGGRAGLLGAADVVFIAMFAGWTWRFALRRRVTVVALGAAPVAGLVLQLTVDTAIPVIPLLAAAFLVPNGDLVTGLVRGRLRVVRDDAAR